MKPTEILDRLAAINVWSKGSQRAPHKPLLLLMALARCSRGEPREMPYKDVDTKLRALLREFGPARATATKAKRDPAFREKVLRAYERRCAVCGFDLRLGSVDVALEAAHIMWHQAGGPDIECNGLALCALHHKLLDRGAFTVSAERRVLVSQEVSGSAGVQEHLLRFHAGLVRKPQSAEYLAKPEYLRWHGREVFRGPARAR